MLGSSLVLIIKGLCLFILITNVVEIKNKLEYISVTNNKYYRIFETHLHHKHICTCNSDSNDVI